jgi:hypothetical protein
MEQKKEQKQADMVEWAALLRILDDDDKRVLYGLALSKLYPRRRWKIITLEGNFPGVRILGSE